MLTHVINLDRSPERLAAFTVLNSHLHDVVRISAVDGQTLNRGDLVKNNTIEPNLGYSDGGLGCALTHISLWTRAVEQHERMLICEDDAIFNHNFASRAESTLAALPPDWDIVLWGWNFDAYLVFEPIPGVSPCLAHFDQSRMRKAVSQFQTSKFPTQPFRLQRAFGTVCYSVSPGGGAKLLESCLPIRAGTVYFPGLNRSLPNSGIDIMMNNYYPQLNAFLCFPPLVITKNEHGISTVQAG